MFFRVPVSICLFLVLCLNIGTAYAIEESPKKLIEWEGQVQLASKYIYRGMNLSNKLAPSLSMGATHRSGFFANFWLGRDDIAGLLGTARDEDVETEYLIGYQRVFTRQWSASISRVWHEFIQDDQPQNHDYQETVLRVNHATAGSVSVGYARDIWSTGLNLGFVYYQYRDVREAVGRKFYLVHELGSNLFDRGSSNRPSTRLDYYSLSAATPLDKGFSVQASYSHGKPSNNNFFNQDRVGSQWVLVLRNAF